MKQAHQFEHGATKENLSLEDIDFIESSAADFYGNYYKGKYITVCLISYMVLKD